jgi:hypothetical protein
MLKHQLLEKSHPLKWFSAADQPRERPRLGVFQVPGLNKYKPDK